MKKFLVLLITVFLLSPFMSWAGFSQGGDIIVFDINPKTILSNVRVDRIIQNTLKVRIYGPQFQAYCGSGSTSFYWGFFEQGSGGDVRIDDATVPFDPTISQQDIDLSYTTLVPVSYQAFSERNFYVVLRCSYDGLEIARSNIVIMQGEIYGAPPTPTPSFTPAPTCPIPPVCASPPPGCYWNQQFDSNGCLVSCGSLVCSSPTPIPSGSSTPIPTFSSTPVPSGTPTPAPTPSGTISPSPTGPIYTPTPTPTFGGSSNPGGLISFPSPYGTQTLYDLLNNILGYAYAVGIPIVVIMLIIGGIMFLMARDDKSKVKKARDIVTYAIVGLAVILIGKGFLTLIASILGL